MTASCRSDSADTSGVMMFLMYVFREGGSNEDVPCVGDLLLKLMLDLKVLQRVCVFGGVFVYYE